MSLIGCRTVRVKAMSRNTHGKLTAHIARKASGIVRRRIEALPIGGKMQDLPEELWHPSFARYMADETRVGGPNLRMIRLDPDEPSLTVTGYIFNKFVHPYEDRFITPREAARLQDFPDDFVFAGTMTSIHRQVGNAVPVRLANAVAHAVMESGRQNGVITSGTPCLSLFSGAGGMDLGFEQAGFQVPRHLKWKQVYRACRR